MKFETYPGRTKVPETINGEEALRTLFLSVGRLGLTKTNVLLSLLSQYESHTALWGAPSLRCQQPLASCEVAAPHQTNRVIQAPLGTCRTFWTPNQHDPASAAFRSLHPDYEIHPDALASLESEGMNNAQSAMEQPQVEVNNGWWAFRRAKYPIKAYSRDSEHVSDFASIRDPETLYICFRYTCSMILSTQHPSGTSSTLQDVREVHHVWNELFEFLGDRWRAIRSDFSRQHPEQWMYANSKIQEQIVEQLHPTCETMLDAHREVHESMFRFLVARIGLCSSVRGGMSGSRSPTVAHEGPKEYREFALPCNPEAQEYFEKFHTQNLEHIHDCFSSHLLVTHYRCLLQSPPAPTSIHEKMPDTRLSQTFALLLLLECGHAPYTSGAEWWADSARLLQRRRHFVYEAIRCGAHRCPVGASYLLYALRCVVALEASQWGLFLELVLKKAPNFIFTCASIPSIPFARIRLLRDLLVGRTPGGTQARVSGELQLREYVAARVQGEDEKGSVSKLSHLCQLFHFDSEITLRQFLSHFLGDTNDPLISKDHHALQCGFIKELRCYKNSAVTAGLCSCAFLLDLESLLPQHSRCECVPVNNPTRLK